MASLVRQAIERVTSNASSNGSSSRRSGQSYNSWGNSKKPRDSLEKTRQRINSITHDSCPQNLLPARSQNLTVQECGEREEEEEDVQSLPLLIRKRPINRNVVCERYPKGKASLLIFLLNAIVIYAYGAAITGILDIFRLEGEQISKEDKDLKPSKTTVETFHFVKLLFQYCISRMFYPVAGFIADVYTGRWRMINIAVILLLIGYITVAVSFCLAGQDEIHMPNSVAGSINLVAFLFISIGGGAFESTIIPFGVDQLQGASSSEISSYFYFFYFSRNVGMGGGIAASCLITYLNKRLTIAQDIRNTPLVYSAFQPMVTTAILSIGLVLMVCFKRWFFKNLLWENPVKLIAKILCYAATVKRHLPIRNRAFRYGEERKKRIELAKITYDGKFPDEKVEDVKAFCRIFLILISLSPSLFAINAFDVVLAQETNQTLTYWHHSSYLMVNLFPHFYWGINTLLILFTLPVVNFLVIPCTPKLTIRARIGIGLVMYCIGAVLVVIIHAIPLIHNQSSQNYNIDYFEFFIPMLIFAVAEVFTVVSALEFIYAQSPESMKGLLSGLYYCFFGLTSLPSSALYYLYQTKTENSVLLRFHGPFAAIMVIGTVCYIVAASLHKNRQRHSEDSLQQRLIIENQLNSTVSA